jgi:chromosome segregation ATPase
MIEDDDDMLCTTNPNHQMDANPDDVDDDDFEGELRTKKYQHEMEVAVENARQDLAPSSARTGSASRNVVPLNDTSSRRTATGQSRAGTDVARLQDEVRGLSNQLRAQERAVVQLTSENDKQQKMIGALNGRIDRDSAEKKDLTQRLKVAETQLLAARKEVSVLQRQMPSTTTTPAGASATKDEPRLQRALSEIDSLRSKLSTPSAEPAEVNHLRSENKKLEAQRMELIQCLRKQNRLIDVLKRQKMHLEAAKLLQITEEEFVKTLEVNHR